MAAIEPDGGLEEVEIRSGDSTVRVGSVSSLLGDLDGESSLSGVASASEIAGTVGIQVDHDTSQGAIADDVEIRTVRRPRSAQGDSRWDDFGALEMMMARVGRG